MERALPVVCCVIPAYRAAGTIVEVVRGCLPHASHIIVVDDGCPERSGQAARAEYRNNPAVQIIDRERNGGVGAAMKTGIEAAIELGADVIVKIDADGQMDPIYIETIAALFEQ